MFAVKLSFPLRVAFLTLLFFTDPSVSAWCQVPMIELRGISRHGGAAGTKFDLRVTAGSQLDEVDELRFTNPVIHAKVKTKNAEPWDDQVHGSENLSGQFSITIDPMVATGCYEVRAIGRWGVSNPLPFWVVPGRHTTREGSSSADPTAIIDRSQVFWDYCEPQAVRAFIIPAEAGERIVLNTLSTMIDSKAALVLHLFGPSGKLLQRVRNLGYREASLSFDCLETGNYRLEVHDHLYRGGWEYSFAILRLSKDSDAPAPFELLRSQFDLLERARVNPPTYGLIPCVRLVESGTLRGVDEGMPIFLHDETAYPRRKAMMLATPCLVEGRFDRNGDEDWIELSATEGEVLFFEVMSQRLGYRTDPHLTVFRVDRSNDGNESIQLIGEQDDGWDLGNEEVRIRSRDPIYRFQAPADGIYRVLILDLQADEGSPHENTWLLSVRPPKPDFTLIAYLPFPANNPSAARPYGNSMSRYGCEMIRVLAIRHDGFDEPIEVRAEGLPTGLLASSSWIAPNQNSTNVQLCTADEAESWVGALSISGTAGTNREHRHYAIPVSVTDGPDGFRNSVVSRLGASITVAVNALDDFPLTIDLPGDAVRTVAKGDKLTLPIALRRRPGGNDRCVLRPQQVPPKWTAGELAIEGNANEGSLEVQIAADAPLGKYSFWLSGETKIKMPWNPQAVERLQARKDQLTQYLDSPEHTENRGAIEQALRALSEQVEQAKKNSSEREFTVFVPSSLIAIEIVEPVKSE